MGDRRLQHSRYRRSLEEHQTCSRSHSQQHLKNRVEDSGTGDGIAKQLRCYQHVRSQNTWKEVGSLGDHETLMRVRDIHEPEVVYHNLREHEVEGEHQAGS